MARYFLESSALVKRYKQEVGTDVVDRLFDFENHELFDLNLAEIEVRKVFYRLWKHPHPGALGKISFSVESVWLCVMNNNC